MPRAKAVNFEAYYKDFNARAANSQWSLHCEIFEGPKRIWRFDFTVTEAVSGQNLKNREKCKVKK